MAENSNVMVGIIAGSGVGEAIIDVIAPDDRHQHSLDTPFGQPSGPIVTGTFAGVDVALLQRHGSGHVLNPTNVPYQANIFALKQLGCTHIIASGACGSLREDIAPGELVLVDQFIDRTTDRQRTFFDGAAVHVEFADPVCPIMFDWLNHAAESIDTTTRAGGTYVCIEGPSFSTRAESHMHRQWGADVVGMTALPEARLAREAEMGYALIALSTDYDCWRPRQRDIDEQSLIQEIIGNLQRSTDAAITLIKAALQDPQILNAQPSPAAEALKLGIWSDKAAIDPAEVKKLDVLWGRYFRK